MEKIKNLTFKKRLILYGISSLIIIGICIVVGIKINNGPSKKTIATADKVKKDSDKGSDVKIEKLSMQQQNGLYKLCKVWGFLKYYHPEVTKGSLDWDQELFKIMPKVLNSKKDLDIDKILLEWTTNLGQFEQQTYKEDNNVKIRPNTQWIKDNTFISGELSAALSKVETAKRNGQNHYVNAGAMPPQFLNEKEYANFDYKNDDGIKLMGLFRYWNIIEYFYSYKNILDKNWDDVLIEFIPKIVESKDELTYKTTLCELTAQIQDGHTMTIDKNLVISNFLGVKIAQINTKFIEGKVVITEKLEDLKKDSNIKVGDVILKVNNKDINDLIKEKLKYFGKTNKETYNKTLLMCLLATNDKTLNLELERDGKVFEEKVNCQEYKKQNTQKPSYETIKENIGYLYPGTLKKSEINGIMEKIKNTKGLIVDLRCYPAVPIMHDLGSYLRKTTDPYMLFLAVNKTVPGQFFQVNQEARAEENKNYYKGKVVIIIDENSQSQSESTAMMFRTAPNAVIIGSKSTGANGDITGVTLPGTTFTQFSGLGVIYPDGRQTQRIGVVPDIEVKPTIEGIKNGKDELLEKAIELMNK